MRSFFYHTYYFWIVTRIAIMSIGLLTIGGTFGSDATDEIVTSQLTFFGYYSVLLLVVAIKEYRGFRGRTWLNKITGVLSLMIGTTLMTNICSFNNRELTVSSWPAFFFITWVASHFTNSVYPFTLFQALFIDGIQRIAGG